MNGFENFQQDQQGPMQQSSMGPPNWNLPVMNPAMMNPWMAYWMGMMSQAGNQNQANSQNGNRQPSNNTEKQQTNVNENQNKQPARPSISCGIIASLEDIKPAEVPMDGSVGLFAKNDLSRIYVKQWGSDGNIKTREFVEVIQDPVPTVQPVPDVSMQDVVNQFNSRFERIENSLSSLLQQMNTKKPVDSNKGNRKVEVMNNG